MMRTQIRRILVVDDRESDTRLLKQQLEASGLFEVREVNDPQAAVFTAERFKPDLILLDLVMPTMDGRHLAACLEASSHSKDVPIVFLPRITKEEVHAVGGRLGGYPFLAQTCRSRRLAPLFSNTCD